jgi:hypothetical protein
MKSTIPCASLVALAEGEAPGTVNAPAEVEETRATEPSAG